MKTAWMEERAVSKERDEETYTTLVVAITVAAGEDRSGRLRGSGGKGCEDGE